MGKDGYGGTEADPGIHHDLTGLNGPDDIDGNAVDRDVEVFRRFEAQTMVGIHVKAEIVFLVVGQQRFVAG